MGGVASDSATITARLTTSPSTPICRSHGLIAAYTVGASLLAANSAITSTVSPTLNQVPKRDGGGSALTGASNAYRDSVGTLKVFSFFSNADQPGNHFIELAWESPPNVSRIVGDFNGDGLPDFMNARPTPNGQPLSSYLVSNPGPGNPNLLRSAKNDLGGVTSIEYAPSPNWSNGYMPQVMHAVTKLSVDDGRGQTAETSYAYSGGLYDPKARKFLGYRTVTETKPLANGETTAPTVVTTYRQDLASYGLPEQVQYKDGAGVVRRKIAETWQVNATSKPYWAKNTATDTTLTETGGAVTSRVTRVFDEWGNLTTETDLGQPDPTGDERLTRRFFTPNTTKFITSLPRGEKIHAGATEAATLVQSSDFIYDGVTDALVAPTKGDLTRIVHYLNAAGTSSSLENFTYDAQGNRLTATDGAGNKTEWSYDATYKLYPLTERLPKYFANGTLAQNTSFETQKAYDPVNFACGQPKSLTDINDIVHSYTYDVFCRLTREQNGATGHYRAVAYSYEGVPTLQSISVSEPLPGSVGTKLSWRYFDGRGRIWRESANSSSAGNFSNVMTTFDKRGNVATRSHPYYTGGTARYTTTTYDWNDRPLIINNPDNSQRSFAYGVSVWTTPLAVPAATYTELTDELFRKVRTNFDSRGNTIRIQQYGGTDGDIIENRAYDVFDRLVKVRDVGDGTDENSGALWTYTYDLVGNRLTAKDPDLGNWTYVYDPANRLIRQTDARGTATSLKYDQMGRLLERCIGATTGCTGSNILAKNTYDEVRTGYYNVGQLTTSENPAVKHVINYHASGQEQQRWTTVTDTVAVTHSRGTLFDDASHKPRARQHGRRGGFRQHVLRQCHHHRPRATGDRGRPGSGDDFRQARDIVGIDLSPEMLEKARERVTEDVHPYEVRRYERVG